MTLSQGGVVFQHRRFMNINPISLLAETNVCIKLGLSVLVAVFLAICTHIGRVEVFVNERRVFIIIVHRAVASTSSHYVIKSFWRTTSRKFTWRLYGAPMHTQRLMVACADMITACAQTNGCMCRHDHCIRRSLHVHAI